MPEPKTPEPARESINPAARRDRPGAPHDDLASSELEPGAERPQGYQEAEVDPLDQGGIRE